jgi:hypothetical protein
MIKENWTQVIWYEDMYEVSDLWNVRSVARKVSRNTTLRSWEKTTVIMNKRKRIMKWVSMKQWYLIYNLSKNGKNKNYLWHRLVYCSFNKISLEFKWQLSKTLICHKNDKTYDNRLENLFIWDQQDNINDCVSKWRNSSWMYEIKNWKKILRKWWRKNIQDKAKLSYEIAQKIRWYYYDTQCTLYEISAKYWVTTATISRILNNKIRKKDFWID